MTLSQRVNPVLIICQSVYSALANGALMLATKKLEFFAIPAEDIQDFELRVARDMFVWGDLV
jgi:hypothetical protein